MLGRGNPIRRVSNGFIRRFGLGLLIFLVEHMIEVGEIEEGSSLVALVELRIGIVARLFKTKVFYLSRYVLV